LFLGGVQGPKDKYPSPRAFYPTQNSTKKKTKAKKLKIIITR
jgi:hypothetical protein